MLSANIEFVEFVAGPHTSTRPSEDFYFGPDEEVWIEAAFRNNSSTDNNGHSSVNLSFPGQESASGFLLDTEFGTRLLNPPVTVYGPNEPSPRNLVWRNEDFSWEADRRVTPSYILLESDDTEWDGTTNRTYGNRPETNTMRAKIRLPSSGEQKVHVRAWATNEDFLVTDLEPGPPAYDSSRTDQQWYPVYVYTLKIDTDGPEKPRNVRITPTEEEDTGRNQTDGITNNTNPQFQWTTPSDPGGSGTRDQYDWEVRNSFGAIVKSGTADAPFVRPGTLREDGRYTFRVRAYDNAGNPGAWGTAYSWESGHFRVDTLPPAERAPLSPSVETPTLTPLIQWNAVDDIWKTDVDVFLYDVYPPQNVWSLRGRPGDSVFIPPGVLAEGHTYGTRLQLWDSAGNRSGWSGPVAIFETATFDVTDARLITTASGSDTDNDGYFSLFDFQWKSRISTGAATVTAEVWADSFEVGVDDTFIDSKTYTITTSDSAWQTIDNIYVSNLELDRRTYDFRVILKESGQPVETYGATATRIDNQSLNNVPLEPGGDGSTLTPGKWTLIIHGLVPNDKNYNTLTGDGPFEDEGLNWMWGLADKLFTESGNVAVHKMDAHADHLSQVISNGTRLPLTTMNVALDDPTLHHVLLVDWAAISNFIWPDGKVSLYADAIPEIIKEEFPDYILNPDLLVDFFTHAFWESKVRELVTTPPNGATGEDGYAQATANALFAVLRGLGLASRVEKIIGHSRGAIVSSGLAQRILNDDGMEGRSLNQVIYLDAEGGRFELLEEYDAPPLYSDYNYFAWTGVRTDNYWQEYNPIFEPGDLPGKSNVLGPSFLHVNHDTITAGVANGYLRGARNFNADRRGVAWGDDYNHSWFPEYLIGTDRDHYSGLYMVNGMIETQGAPDGINFGQQRSADFGALGELELFNGSFEGELRDSTAGWWYHGGGFNEHTSGRGIIINGELVLETTQYRIHNWTYVPSAAESVKFDLDVYGTPLTAELVVAWAGADGRWEDLARLPLSSMIDRDVFRVNLLDGIAGTAGRLKFEVTGNDSSSVHLDDISWSDELAPAAVIDVELGITGDVHGHDFGSIPLGQAGSETFTVRNEGDAPLFVYQATGLNSPFSISPINGSDTGDDWRIPVGETREFTVSFRPTSRGPFSETLTLENSDPEVGEYVIDFAGNGIGAEIEVSGKPVSTAVAVEIMDGDTVASTADGTDFGRIQRGQPGRSRTFTIRNDGDATLELMNVSLAGGTSYTLVGPSKSRLSPGDTTTFSVTLNTGTVGPLNDGVLIDSNDSDPDRQRFSFAIKGSVTVDAPDPLPEITVLWDSGMPSAAVEIMDGDTLPNATNGTDFGSVQQGQPGRTRTFIIRNDGDATLDLMNVSLAGGTSYTLAGPSKSSLAPGESDVFTVTLPTSSLGLFNDEVWIDSNDSDPDTQRFSFAVTGTVTEDPPDPLPEITVLWDPGMPSAAVEIVDGDTSPSTADGTDFGGIQQGQPDLTRTFIIRNDGDANLDLMNIRLAGGMSYTLAGPAKSSLAPGESDIFTVTLHSGSLGTFNDEVRIDSNASDLDERRFTFTITGTVAVDPPGPLPEITVLWDPGMPSTTVEIMDGDTSPSPSEGTDFGSVEQGQPGQTRTFAIRNDGDATLNLTAVTLEVGVAFTIVGPSVEMLAPGQSDTFTVTLQSGAAGTFNDEVRIDSNDGDPDEQRFSFAITGIVTRPRNVFVNDDFTSPDGTPIGDADPNTPGDQPAIIGVTAFATIQEGVDTVAAWGTVHVTDDLSTDGPGLYLENVSVGEHVEIRSTEDDATAVVVDGSATGRVFSIGAFSVVMNGLTVRNGLADEGGGVLNDAGILTINNSVLTENMATRFGGGIMNDGGRVYLNEVMLLNNFASASGGGLHNAGDGRVYVDAALVDGNSAGEEGGGLWNSTSGILIVRNASTISNNTASGAAAEQGGGGVFNDGGRLAIQAGSAVSNNVANGEEGSGGGIFSLNGIVTVENSSITNNTTVRAGGGVEFVTGEIELTNSHLDNNRALGGPVTTGDGGGLHVTGRSGQVGRIWVIGGSVSGNTAATEGGGLWNEDANIMVIRAGAVIDGNRASGDATDDGGGGIFNNSGRLAIGEAAVISNNIADGTSGSGGGIFSMGNGVSIEGSTISGNAANRAGGGIEVIHGLVTIVGSTIDGNNAGVTGTANPGSGGGVHVSGTNFTRVDVRNSVVSNNSAALEGGGLWNSTNGVMLIRLRSLVTGNTAHGNSADDGGGGIFNHGGRLLIHNVSIDHNRADGIAGSGGGIFTRDGVTTIEAGTVWENTANGVGGGIEIVDGWLAMKNVEHADNEATLGGGIHVSGSNGTRVKVERSYITGNRAAQQGGGIWHQAGSTLVLLPGTKIGYNSANGDAENAGGGGIFNNGGRVAVTGSVIFNNWALGEESDGGGILSFGGGLTLDNSTVSRNYANGNGGGIVNVGQLITANATIAINESDADGDGSGIGGGILNVGTATLKNTIVAGNVSQLGVAHSDIDGNTLSGSGHNLISDANSSGGLSHGLNGNIVGVGGTGVLPLATILDPSLSYNGGPTLTHALAASSPAIDAGYNTFARDLNGIAFTTDQRGVGFQRTKNGLVDIGAFEA